MEKCKVCPRQRHTNGFCKRHHTQFLRHGRTLPRTNRDPNKIINRKTHCEIVIYNVHNKEIARAKIDQKDLNAIKIQKWHLDSRGYVSTNIKIDNGRKRILLHNFIMEKKKGYMPDHINRNKLDNRRKNLRFVTPQQNCFNRTSNSNTGTLGVYRTNRSLKKKYRAGIQFNGKTIDLGWFLTLADAIKARQIAQEKYFKLAA